jgi:RHS repeat-associated protein
MALLGCIGPPTAVARLDRGHLHAPSKALEYAYDFGRLVRVKQPFSGDLVFHYGKPGAPENGAGRVVRVQDEAGEETRGFGKLGETVRSTRLVRPLRPGDKPQKLETRFEFDGFGEKLEYVYDAGGLLVSAVGRRSTAKEGLVTEQYLKSLRYDVFGQRVRMELGNGVVTHYAYEPDTRRLATLGTQTPSGRTLQALSYGYDRVGNIESLVNALGQPTAARSGAVTFGFKYDDLDRLKAASGTALSRPGVVDRFETSFDYSDLHNMTRKRQVRELDTGGVVERPAHSNHDLQYLYEGPAPHQATRIGGTVLTYDASGNTLSECKSPPGTTCASGGGTPEQSGAQLRRYVWTEQNWLRAVVDGGGKNETRFLYDASGQRVAKLGRSGTSLTVGQFYSTKGASIATKHIFAGETRLASKVISPPSFKVGGGAKWAGYLPGCEPSQSTPSKCFEPSGGAAEVEMAGSVRPATYYYHPDHLGSTGWVTDQAGKVHEHVEYFPYGEVWRDVRGDAEGGPQAGPQYRFTGKEFDEETGLTYFGARYYDAHRARWLSTDPMLVKLGSSEPSPALLSSYLYSYGNPVGFKDPDGEAAYEVGEFIEGTHGFKAATGFSRRIPWWAGGLYFFALSPKITIDAGAALVDSLKFGTGAGKAQACTTGECTALALSEDAGRAGTLILALTLPATAKGMPSKGTPEVVPPSTPIVAAKGAGRGGNKLTPDPAAQGQHTTFKTDPQTGKVTGHAEWQPNPKNPSGFDQAKRVDTQYANPHTHHNNATGQPVPTPHVHDKAAPGGVRPARPDELPR